MAQIPEPTEKSLRIVDIHFLSCSWLEIPFFFDICIIVPLDFADLTNFTAHHGQRLSLERAEARAIALPEGFSVRDARRYGETCVEFIAEGEEA